MAIRIETTVESSGVTSGLREIQNAVSDTSKKIASEGKTIDDVISNISSKLNVAIGGWTATQFVNQMMQVRGQFQQTEQAFRVMLGSEEKAMTLMNQLIHTAAITPFGVTDVTEGAKQLLAYNTAAEEVNDTLIGLGDIAAGMGLALSDLVMLYGTTIAKGKMDTMDLRQFMNRGIPIAEELAKVMGLDVADAINQVSKAIKEGKATSEVFEQAIKNLTAEGGKFGGLMEAQSKTITGQISNLEDGIEQMFNELGRMQETSFNLGLDIAGTLIDNWRTVGKIILTIAAAYGAYKAAVIAAWVAEKAHLALNAAKAWLSLARSITSAKDALALFNLTSKASVVGALLSVIAAAVTYFKLFNDEIESASELTNRFGDDANKASQNVETLVSILKQSNATGKVSKDVMQELSSIYSNYGIEIQKIKEDESNLIEVKDEQIKKSQELVEQIKLESVERSRANAISAANERYNSSVKGAQNTLSKGLTDKFGQATGTGLAIGIQNAVSSEDIAKLEELYRNQKKYKDWSKEWIAIQKQIDEAHQDVFGKAGAVAKEYGLSIKSVLEYVIEYRQSLLEARKRVNEETEAINKAADATEKFNGTNLTAAQRLNETQKQLQKAGEDVKTLYGRVKTLMQEYSQNKIAFEVNFDAKIPAWMQKMDIPELGRLGKYFSALAKEMAQSGKKVANVNGKTMSIDEVAQRGWDYTNAANTKQDEADKKAKKDAQKKAEEEEKNKKNKNKEKKAAEDRKKLQKELNEDLKRLQQENIDNDIALQKDGTEKQIAEIKNSYKKQIAEIDKQQQEFKEKNKKAGIKTEASGLTAAQSSALSTARENAEKEQTKALADLEKERLEQQLQYLYDYLKEYGTIQEQRYAITKEYDDKIAKAKDENQKALLQKQKESAVSQANAKNMAMDIDWGTSFEGVGNVLKEIAKTTLAKVEDYIKSDEFKGLTAESKKSYTDLRDKLRSEVGGGTSPFDFSQWEKIAQQTRAYQDSVKNLLAATANHDTAVKNLEAAEKELSEATTDEAKEIAQAKVNTAKAIASSTGKEQNAAQAEKDNAQDALNDSTNKAAQGMQNFQNVINEISGGSLYGFANGISKLVTSLASGSDGVGKALGELGGKIGGIIGAILQILDALGDDPSQFIGDLIGKVEGVIDGILDQIASGELIENLFESIMSLIGTIVDHMISDPFTALGIDMGGDSDPELKDDIEELTASNDALKKSIDILSEKMEDASSMNELTETYEQQKENLEQTIKNMQEMMSRSAAAYKNGTFGIGGKHSSNKKIDDEMSSDDWQRISNIVGSAVSRAGDFWSLTSEQMSDVAAEAPDLYAKIKEYADDGYADAAQYMDDYIEYYKQLQDLQDTYRESLTSVTFDDIESNFADMLSDLDSDAEDFSENLEEMLTQALVNSMMVGKYKSLLKDWYKNFSDAVESGGELDEDEVRDLRAEYNDIVEKALSERNALAKTLSLDGTSSQDASSGGWESMGQETADELNGRFTALQIAGETISSSILNVLASMESMTAVSISSNGAVLEIRNMMIMTNSYLEDMVKYAKSTYNDFGVKLDDIKKELKNM